MHSNVLFQTMHHISIPKRNVIKIGEMRIAYHTKVCFNCQFINWCMQATDHKLFKKGNG